MKPQFHRSLTFWSGILAMTFIAWGWWDSFQETSSVSYRYKLIRNADGGVAIGHYPGEAGGTPAFLARRSATKLVHPPWSASPGAFLVRGTGGPEPMDDDKLRREATQSAHQRYLLLMHSQPAREWILFIPHCLIILLFAIPWALLLVWRARRRIRLATPAAEQAGAPGTENISRRSHLSSTASWLGVATPELVPDRHCGP